MTTTVVFTGGHHNSALVVAEALKKQGVRIIWFGHKFTSRSDKSLSAEFQEVTSAKIPFYELKTGKFYRQSNPLEYLKIILGFLQSFFYLLKIKPKLIVSFGGYLAVPTVISGAMLGIKSITHEQTVVAGWANKAISPFVDKILITHKSSLPNYPKNKTIPVGLPIRKNLLDKNHSKHFDPPLIYISCGKQGSHIVNRALFPLIPQLVKRFTVIHQTGANTQHKDIERARRVKESLKDLSSRYIYAPYFFSNEAPTYLRSAKLVISRAGAHLTYELMLLGKRSVLIPISWVSHNEQLLNAKLAIKHIPGVIIQESDLSSDNLLKAINQCLKLPSKPKLKLDTNAQTKVLDIINSYL